MNAARYLPGAAVLVLLAHVGADAALAQTAGATADLSYSAASRGLLSYITVETRERLTDAGTVAERIEIRRQHDVELTPLDHGILAVVTPHELSGDVRTTDPAGSRTVEPGGVRTTEPAEQMLSVRGVMPDNTFVPSFDAILGEGPLLFLPGREVRLKESWTDTAALVLEIDGALLKIRTVVRGTWDRDTVLDGVRLNVLLLESGDVWLTNDTVAGVPVSTAITGGRSDTVLWDPQRHRMVAREYRRELMTVVETPEEERTSMERRHVVTRLLGTGGRTHE